ncbi:VirB4 family type IV secretion system protein [Halorientalis brevis]|uniref:VirB4 family type IV secretion system protein n=1 Tax=Halorientalis brevis TaxID=1126241 RepID=A0ABD6CF73_9EURY
MIVLQLPGIGSTSPVLIAIAVVGGFAAIGLLLLLLAQLGLISKNDTFEVETEAIDEPVVDEAATDDVDGTVDDTTGDVSDDTGGNTDAAAPNADSHSDTTEPEAVVDDGSDTDDVDEPTVIDDVSERQLSAIAPRHIIEDDEHYEHLRIEDDYVRSYFIDGWPEHIRDGAFEDVFTQPGLDYDVSIHVDPLDTTDALADLKDKIRDLESEYELLLDDGQTIEARDMERKLHDYREMRDTIRDTDAELVDVSMYVTVAAPTEDLLDRASDDLEDMLEKAGMTPILKTKDQERTLRSNTPIAKDEVGKKHSMMGGAVGAMMPFSSGTLMQDEGIPIGEHAANSSPIIYDRFTHDRGYNMLTIGNIGAGKSFSTKLHLLRRHLYDPDTIIVMLDPLQGFAGLCSALGGQPVTVGGDFGLNPLEIREPPEHVKEDPQVDPGKAKMKDLKAFFESFFEMRGEELGERWTTLQRALRIAYREQNIILDDPDTHGNPNPTIREHVVPVLLEMVTDVEEHTIIKDIVDDDERVQEILDAAEEVTDEERERAAQLLLAMEPFLEGGALSNLGRKSEFDIEDEDVVYLDLQQQESRGGLGLMMNLLFSAVYERAKQSDKKIIFAIDEARYIMRDKAALQFLEQAVRHSRHYDLSIQFITQTVGEFFQHEEARAIAEQCDHKLFFHIEGLDDDLREKVDMNEREAKFVRNATPGDEERGYSEAAFGVADKGWYPVHVRASDIEAAVVDLEPGEDVRSALPGMDESERVPEQIQEFRDRLLEKYGEEVEVSVRPEKMVPEIRVTNDNGEEELIVDHTELRRSGPDMDKRLKEALADAGYEVDEDDTDDVSKTDTVEERASMFAEMHTADDD